MTGFLLCGLWPDYGRIVVFAITSVLEIAKERASLLMVIWPIFFPQPARH